jgi:hypothetical protein
MNVKDRHNRIRQLVIEANQLRKKQAQKMDILCNDLICAQRNFIKKLDTISFTAIFYESIVGQTELTGLLYSASNMMKKEIPDANIAFFLRQEEAFKLHILESQEPVTFEKPRLENCFTPELAEEICKSNKPCTLEDLFSMGLHANLSVLNQFSLVTLPLELFGRSIGFILIYRSSQNRLTHDELMNISAITPGLSQAIDACQILLNKS